MDFKTFENNTDVHKELELRKEHFVEILKLFVLICDIKQATFFKYDFKYNSYQYDFTVDVNNVIDGKEDIVQSKYSIVLKNNDVIFGKIVFDQSIESNFAIKEILKKAKIVYQRIFDIEKDFYTQNRPLNIYIITDEQSKTFAAKLHTNLDVLLNANLKTVYDISTIASSLAMKNSKNIIIYTVQDNTLINRNEKLLQQYNEFIIVIGPNDHSLSLQCGQLNILSYMCFDDFSPEAVKSLILSTKNKLQNKHHLNNKIIAIGGVCGGIGSTTVAMNVADILALNCHEKNILYIDLSTTKAISNLFLSQNPVPKHTIIDLMEFGDFSLDKNLQIGLVKVRENFYAINGIQKHIDKDLLDKEVFIEKFLDYILSCSEYFNYIVIDVGVADASPLNTTVYDLANEVWVLTELAIPHVSTLKTFYSLMKRAGLKDKISFLVNRVNSLNEISLNDFDSIMSTSVNDDVLEYEKIPNDYETLGKCWNYCELASQVSKNSPFVKQLGKILSKKEYLKGETIVVQAKKDFFSFFKKGSV